MERFRFSRATLERWFPAVGWIPRYTREQFSGDLIAGIIVAVLLVPQGMAYAMLAGLPPQAGLYASIIPLVIYGLMGTSRALAIGPVAIVALLTASSVGALAAEGTQEYITLALILALMVGVIQIVLGLLRAGFVVNFLSHPVLSGFINAAALIIGASQLAHLFGLAAGRSDTFLGQMIEIGGAFETINLTTTVIGVSSLLALLYFQKLARGHLEALGFPAGPANFLARSGPLLTVAAASVVVWGFSLDERSSVTVVGAVPSGLPLPSLPLIELSQVQALIPAAILISLVGFMESISIAKSLASRERERIDPDQELVALGTANIGATFGGGFPVTGSFSRSVLNYSTGAKTGMASIITAGIVLTSLLVLTPLFFYLPRATLSAIVIVAVAGLIETTTFRRVWSYRPADALTLIITFVAVLTIGVELGIIAGILSSIGLYLWRTSHPAIVELGLIRGSDVYRETHRHSTTVDPRVLLLRVDESLYFANTQRLQDVVTSRLHSQPEMDHLVLVGTAINDIDASALETLEELNLQLSSAGVTLHLAGFKATVLERLRRTLLMQMIGPDRTHLTVNAAVAAINQKLPANEPFGAKMTLKRDNEA
ncbi:MAG: sulfate permease [Sphaerobacteraceae bacterium]|nr:MAG: sulfate permease [Sphaerobacteraceae bacterium]